MWAVLWAVECVAEVKPGKKSILMILVFAVVVVGVGFYDVSTI